MTDADAIMYISKCPTDLYQNESRETIVIMSIEPYILSSRRYYAHL
jgi:hypothetical protein